MKVTICIGSSCHLKGARIIIEEFQRLISKYNLDNEIELCGSPCLRNCTMGVSLKIDDVLYSVKPENAEKFFKDEILFKLKRGF